MYLLAIVIDLLGILVGLRHWQIMNDKLTLIAYYEKRAKIWETGTLTHNQYSVNSLIILTYGVVASAYFALLLSLLPDWLVIADGVGIVLSPLAAALLAFVLWPRKLEKNKLKIEEKLAKSHE